MAQQLIREYLRDTGSKPVVWGQTDCVLWMTGLVGRATGRDPSDPYRGTYDTWMGARRIIMAHGGFMGLANAHLAALTRGERRDGVCLAKAEGQTIFGILCGGHLNLKGDRTIVQPKHFEILEGWSLWPKH